MKKILLPFIAMGALFVGCSSETSSDPTVGESPVVKEKTLASKGESMWSALQRMGVSEYFDSLSQSGVMPAMASNTSFGGSCASPALKMDENTRYLDELESVFDEGEQVKGVCGNALKLNDGQVAPLGVNLIDSLSVGTVEFWFRPNADFLDASARTLLGNDGSRVHFFYKNGELYFQKNHADQHFFVKGAVTLGDDWNLIAGQWGDGYMSLWVNGTLVAKMKHELGYAPARRNKPFENLLVIGYKSYCCMEGAGQFEGMTTSGSFDQFRISNIPRYEIVDGTNEEVEDIEIDDTDTSVCAMGLEYEIIKDMDKSIEFEIKAHKVCFPDGEEVSLADIYDQIGYSLETHAGTEIAPSLPVGSVYYGCIDLTGTKPVLNLANCTGLGPGSYRLYFSYEGKRTYYSFKVAGVEIE